MLVPELKRLSCADIADLQVYKPGTEAFALSVQALVGPRGVQGEESFSFVICTPEWLKGECATRMLLGLHHLIVPSYDYHAIVAFISKIVSSCSANTWEEAARKLDRLGHWEFDGYRAAL